MKDPFDFNRIKADLGMDHEDIRHLMSIYRTELHKDFNELDEDFQRMDWSLLKNKLHKMKGDAANMCLPPISDAFAEMENTVLSRDLTTLASQLSSIKFLESQFTSALECYLKSENKDNML